MLPKEFHQADEMMPFGCKVPRLSTLSLMLVHERRCGIVKHFPALSPHSETQINIFEIEEKPLIKQVGIGDRRPPYQHGCSQPPIHCSQGLMIPVKHQMFSDCRMVRSNPVKGGSPQDQRPKVVKSPAGVL
jgi:hypothetical protein